MAIFRFNPNAPIPNNPFYSAPSSFVEADTGQLIVGTGLTVDYNAGTINATGGGGGGAVNVVTGTSPIVVTGPVTNPVVAVLGATQTSAGVIEIATAAEVAAGVSSTLAVTPFTLSSNYMPRSGGTFTGPVTFGAPIVANSTACFVGAVTNANNVTNIGAVTNCSSTTTFGAVTNCGTTTNVGAVTNCALVTNRAAVVNCSTTTNVGAVTNCSNVTTCGTTTNVGAVTNLAPVTNCSTTTNVGPVTNCALVLNCNNVITCGTTTNVGAVTNCALVTNCGPTVFCNTATFTSPVTFCSTPILPAGTPLGCAICITYSNATSGLTATNVQAAIDELALAGGATPATTSALGIVCIGSNISVTPAGEISVAAGTTALPGVVQLYDGLNSPSNTLALTALQGCCLQQQINSLTVAGGVQLAGTLDASTGLVASTTTGGSGAGFTTGAVLPAASATTNNYYVIVTVAGTVTPPGGLPTAASQGDWFLVTEASPGVYSWSFLNVGFDAPAATTTNQGIVELATTVETQVGTDATRAVTPAGLAATSIPKTALTAKGALIVATGAGTCVSLPVGADGLVLTTDSTTASGLKWAAGGGGGVTSVTAGTGLTGGTITTTGTIALANTAVTAGTYTYATVAVDAQGRITAAASGANPVPRSAFTSIGDMLAGTGVGTYTTIGVGVDGQILTACSSAPGGVCWGPAGGTGTVTSISTGTGLTGGPISTTGTISLLNTAVTPGSYTYANFTVDAQGRLTAAGNGVAPVTSITAGTGLSGGTITSTGTIALTNTAVTAGSYTNTSLTVDAQGRITAATSGTAPVTSVTGTAPIAVTAGTAPVVSIAAASTTNTGAVQLYNGVNSTSTTLALTACQGKVLQDQINALATSGGTILAGTFNASNSQMLTVTTSGSGAGFTVGSNIPAAALGNNNYYVIVTTGGSYAPPGGVSVNATQGDWFLSNGTSWQFLDVGASVAYATTTTAGSVCLSTNALAQAGTDTLTALTPATATSAFIQRACITAKGAILTGTAASTPTALGVGTDGQILTACAACTTGLTWTSAGAAGIPCACVTGKGAIITGTAVNAPLALAVGTDGQYLIADSTCVTGLKWGAGGIPCSCFTAKGQLISATAANAPSVLTVGADGQVLTACSACTSGLTWVSSSSNPATPTTFGTVKGCTTLTCTALGCNAALNNTAADNVAIGSNALCAVTTGFSNTAIGSGAARGGTSNYNVALGFNALCGVTTGGANVALGAIAGKNLTTGANNVIIGPNLEIPNPAGNFQLAIGYDSTNWWLTGCSDKSIKPGAGIRDCTDSLGTAGQVLCSTGSAVVWATPSSGSSGVYFGKNGSTALCGAGLFAATWTTDVFLSTPGSYTYAGGCFTPNVAGWYMMNLNSFNAYNSTVICAYLCSSNQGCISCQIINSPAANFGCLNMSAPVRFDGVSQSASVWVYSNGTVRHGGTLTFMKVAGL